MQSTIAAIATAPGQGGVSIVRMSGTEAERILMSLFRPAQRSLTQLQSHLLTYGHVVADGQVLDECMAVIMRAPRSYTREDVVEFQLHGGSWAAQHVLDACLQAGARLAEPGEFTRRAFLNGRIDLSQAEAVMNVIAAQGDVAHQAAMNQLAGGAGSFIRQAADELYQIQAGVAACIDYPEEITDEEATEDLVPRIQHLAQKLRQACDERAAKLITTGLQVALCGRPNVGKSSLLNALLGEERAIVTDIAGTTRDVVQGDLLLGGTVIHLTDTAGIRDTTDQVEAIGVARAEKAVAQADVTLLVLDASQPISPEDRVIASSLAPEKTLILLNKADLPEVTPLQGAQALVQGASVLRVCAKQEEGLTAVKQALVERSRVSDQLVLTQPRHLDSAKRAITHLHAAVESMHFGGVDLAAIDLQSAQMALGEITGDQVEERLLDAVFSTFCVGK